MIETKRGVENFEQILKKFNKSISGTIIGLYDLSASFNIIGKIENQIIKKQLSNYLKISKKFGVPTGIHHANFMRQVYKIRLEKLLKSIKTYKYIAFGTETLFLNYLIDDL